MAPIDELGRAIAGRFDGVVDRLSFNVPYVADPATWEAVLEESRRRVLDESAAHQAEVADQPRRRRRVDERRDR